MGWVACLESRVWWGGGRESHGMRGCGLPLILCMFVFWKCYSEFHHLFREETRHSNTCSSRV